jgi:hypothetical protein
MVRIVANNQQRDGQGEEGDRCTEQIRPSMRRFGRFTGGATRFHNFDSFLTLGQRAKFSKEGDY